MEAKQAGRLNSNRTWWWLTAVVAAIAIVVTVVIASGAGAPGGSGSAGATASGVVPTESASGAVSPGASSAAPSATPSRKVKKLAYCSTYAEIKTPKVSSTDDEGNLDFAALSKQFGQLIKMYSRAAKAAPSSLDADYAAVLGYLKEMKAAADSRELDQIKVLVTNLELLNNAMAKIQTESKAICG